MSKLSILDDCLFMLEDLHALPDAGLRSREPLSPVDVRHCARSCRAGE